MGPGRAGPGICEPMANTVLDECYIILRPYLASVTLASWINCVPTVLIELNMFLPETIYKILYLTKHSSRQKKLLK